jgi:hypothetical protein
MSGKVLTDIANGQVKMANLPDWTRQGYSKETESKFQIVLVEQIAATAFLHLSVEPKLATFSRGKRLDYERSLWMAYACWCERRRLLEMNACCLYRKCRPPPDTMGRAAFVSFRTGHFTGLDTAGAKSGRWIVMRVCWDARPNAMCSSITTVAGPYVVQFQRHGNFCLRWSCDNRLFVTTPRRRNAE